MRQSYRLLSQVMGAAQQSGLIASSPCTGIKVPRLPETEPSILTREQVGALVAVTAEPYDLLLEVLAYGGLRIGEALALRRKRLDLLAGRLVVVESLSDADGRLTFETTKNHQQRTVAVPRFLAERLSDYLDTHIDADPEALLFTGSTGQPVRYAGFVRRAWRPAVAAAGLVGVTPHDLRATHATWLIDDGWSVIDVANRLGHSRATVTTRHYARPVLGRDDEIAARLDVLERAMITPHRARSGHAEGTANLRVAT